MTSGPAPFAVWITGLPASGKSTLAEALVARLAASGVRAVRLESDALRGVLAPGAGYDDAGRDAFYGALAGEAARRVRGRESVVVDATANRRAYRDWARGMIDRFAEVWVDTPLPVCEARDPKGIYRRGRAGEAGGDVPGLAAPYEPPGNAEVVVRGDAELPDEAAGRIVSWLRDRGWLDAKD
jgi:adenylylsulfate kinase